MIFDAVCIKDSETEGYLRVELRASSNNVNLGIAGTFISYIGPTQSDPKKSILIPIQQCQELEQKLLQRLAKPILFEGSIHEKSFQETLDIWGECKEHPLIGGTYPCKKGTKQVTRYNREYFLNLDSIFLFYKNY